MTKEPYDEPSAGQPEALPVLDYRRPLPPLEHFPVLPTHDAGRARRSGCLAVTVFLLGIGTLAWMRMNQIYGRGGIYERSQCAIHLRLIAQACQVYASDSGGAYPQRIEQLLSTLDTWHFGCPGADDWVGAKGQTVEAQVADFAKPGRCSYIYFGVGLMAASPPHTPIACDRLENHAKKGIQVVHLDGSVVWLERKEAEAFLANLPATAQHPPAPQPSR